MCTSSGYYLGAPVERLIAFTTKSMLLMNEHDAKKESPPPDPVGLTLSPLERP